MRFSLGLPTDRIGQAEEFICGTAIASMAQAVERAGLHAVFVTDHPFPPTDWLATGGHHALDPFVALSFAAAHTTRLQLHTHVLVLPYRNPFLAAKNIATLDVLSGGRVIAGVAAGYLEGEFEALGAPFAARNEVPVEYLEAMKAAWSGVPVNLAGQGFAARGNVMLPKPLQVPHPPLWMGGNSNAAIRRAVELCEGWSPFPNTAAMAPHTRSPVLEGIDDLRRGIDYAREHAAKVGRRTPLEVCFSLSAFSKGRLDAPAALDLVAALEAIGVTWCVVTIPARTRGEYCENVGRFAGAVGVGS